MSRVYGDTFLTRPRWWTSDAERAERSPFCWVRDDTDLNRDPLYELSLLGVVNGLLDRLGADGGFVPFCTDRGEIIEWGWLS